jgi:hypothetical protein
MFLFVFDESAERRKSKTHSVEFSSPRYRHTSRGSIQDTTTLPRRTPLPIKFIPVENSEGCLEPDCAPVQKTAAGPEKEKEVTRPVRAPASDGSLIAESHNPVCLISSRKTIKRTAYSVTTRISEASTKLTRAKKSNSKAPLPRILASSNVPVVVTYPSAWKRNTTRAVNSNTNEERYPPRPSLAYDVYRLRDSTDPSKGTVPVEKEELSSTTIMGACTQDRAPSQEKAMSMSRKEKNYPATSESRV